MKQRAWIAVLGLALLFVGCGYIGDAFQLWHFTLFFKGWWTIFLVIPALVSIIKDKMNAGNFFLLALGVALFLKAQGILTMGQFFLLWIPIAFVVFGVFLIFKSAFRKQKEREIPESLVEALAFFVSKKITISCKPFYGAELTSVFGSIELDLTDAFFEPEAVLSVSAIFGGIDIKLPPNVKLILSDSSLFGGIQNKYSTEDVVSPVLSINSTCICAGVDIKMG